jgi:hypothetical protein
MALLNTSTPIAPGKEAASHSSDPRVIYLAPRCCYSDGEGRQWCEDNVWPCSDCPDRANARVAKYYLGQQFQPASSDAERHEETD